MITNSIKELQEYRERVAQLESKIARELKAELAALPGKYGYASIEAFIAALRETGGVRRGRKPGRPPAAGKKVTLTPTGKKRRPRTTITAEMKAQVKAAVLAKKTSAVIAKEVGISLPSVQNIKKAFGLVNARK